MSWLDVWSTDPVVALRAVASARARPSVDAQALGEGAPRYEAALALGMPILLPQLVPLIAACLGWSTGDVEAIARGAGVADGAVDPEPTDAALGPAVLVPLLAQSRAPEANALRAAGLSPEAFIVACLPVPSEDEAPTERVAGIPMPSRIHAAFHHLALADVIATTLSQRDAPAILCSYEVARVDDCVRELLRTVRGAPPVWEPLDVDAIASVMRERITDAGAAPESITSYTADALTALVIPNRGTWPPRRPTTPVAVCFVADGCLLLFPHALAHVELPSGRVRALHAAGDTLRFNAVSDDARFVQCIVGDEVTGEWWPEVAVYSVESARWATEAPPGLPTTVLGSLHGPKQLQVFDLARRTSRVVATEYGGDTCARIATSPDGTFAWRRRAPHADQRGIVHVATDRTVDRPTFREPRRGDDTDDEEDGLDDSARALVARAGRFLVFCEGRVRDGGLERFRADEVGAAAFSACGDRLALVYRHVLRVLELAADGTPTRELRVDLLPLRSLITLDRFWSKASWSLSEDAWLAALHTIPALRACADAEEVLAKFAWSAPSFDECEDLWAVSRLVSDELPALPTSQLAPSPESPPGLLLGERALVVVLPRWVAPREVTARELALRCIADGAMLLDREVNDDETWAHSGVHEWVLSARHGLVRVIEHTDTNVVVAVADDARDLTLLGDEPPLLDEDDLIRWALIEPGAIELDGFIDDWENDEDVDEPGITWATALAGSPEQQERVLAIARGEGHEHHRDWIEHVLALVSESSLA